MEKSDQLMIAVLDVCVMVVWAGATAILACPATTCPPDGAALAAPAPVSRAAQEMLLSRSLRRGVANFASRVFIDE